MKNIFKKALYLLALLAWVETYGANCNTSCNTNTGCGTTSPFLFTRSQGRNKVLQVVGKVGHTHLDGMESFWDNTTVLVAYERSFRTNRITECLFGTGFNTTNTLTTTGFNHSCNTDCDTTSIQIQGSAVKTNPNSWLADNFYLAPDFQSTISFRPRISNVLVYLDEYIGLDELFCGLYLRLYGPIVHTRWDLSFCESNINTGTQAYPFGYFSPDPIGNKSLVQTFGDYSSGIAPVPAVDLNIGSSVLFQPLKYAKIRKESKKRTGFADLRAELGWDFWQTECYHIGFNIQMAAPTGNSPDADYLFDPIVGNGNHWELGGGVTAHYLLWANEAQDATFGVYLDANVTHLFKARQQRTFDLIGKPVSRYQLAERLTSPSVNLLGNHAPGVAGVTAPAAQFASEFAPVANLTTADVKVSIGAQADIVLWLNYSACNWSVDLGYNLWVTSREKYTKNDCRNDCKNPYYLCNNDPAGTWALKGDARVFGFTSLDASGTLVVPLSATESSSTIFGGTNAGSAQTSSSSQDPLYNNNAGVDNPQFATNSTANLLFSVPGTTAQISTSVAPLALCCASVDQVSHKGLTNKIFGHVSYTLDCECVVPYFGVGGSAEFASRKCSSSDCVTPTATPCPIPATNVSSSNCNTKCDENRNSSRRCTPSLWSVWANVGVTFN